MSEETAKTVTLPILHCLRCGHQWVPKMDWTPRVCPRCKNAWWNKPRTVARKKPAKKRAGNDTRE